MTMPQFHWPIDPIQFVYGAIAVCGGVARYLNNYLKGDGFKMGMLVASAFVSGFSGYMFALVGISLALPNPMLYTMAGVGGFFGEQTMRLVYEYAKSKSIQ